MNNPKPTGEYKVGTMTYSLYGERNIACRVYYPITAEAAEGCSKPRYMSREVCKGITKTLMFPINYDKIEKSGGNVSECYENAPHIEGKKFPLIVFSHGAGGYRESNSFMCIEFASHGYIVLCIAHPGFAACAEYDNGTFEYAEKNLTFKTYKPYLKGAMSLLKFMKEKGSDRELADKLDGIEKAYCAYLLSNLSPWEEDTKRAASYAKENLSYMIDFDKGIGVMGHSYGGATAYALCQHDPEYVCGINLDGIILGDFTGKVLETPFMQISCEANLNVVTRAYLDHRKPVYKVVFKDMEHLGFSDMKHAIASKRVVGALPPDVFHDNVCRCQLEFFDAYLKKTKDHPELSSNEAVTATEIAPDI